MCLNVHIEVHHIIESFSAFVLRASIETKSNAIYLPNYCPFVHIHWGDRWLGCRIRWYLRIFLDVNWMCRGRIQRLRLYILCFNLLTVRCRTWCLNGALVILCRCELRCGTFHIRFPLHILVLRFSAVMWELIEGLVSGSHLLFDHLCVEQSDFENNSTCLLNRLGRLSVFQLVWHIFLVCKDAALVFGTSTEPEIICGGGYTAL
jgi:hypothetical protein